MNRSILLLALSWLITVTLFAQTSSEALMYGTQHTVGTARYTAMGGSMGALGGDFSTLSTNPAGIGIYKSSEFMVTPALFNTSDEASYYGTTVNDGTTTFNFSNIGILWAVDMVTPPDSKGIKTVQFGFGLNRINNYNRRMSFSGFNDQSSFLTGVAERANVEGIAIGTLPGMAYDANLIYDDNPNPILNPQGTNYITDMPNGQVEQVGFYDTEGSLQELVLSGGANLNDKIYFGVSLTLPMLHHVQRFGIQETDTENKNSIYHGMDYYETITTDATGVAGKFGIIVRTTDWLRLGVAVHTPTLYANMNDQYTSNIYSYFDAGHEDLDSNQESPFGEYKYELTTPFRTIGSAAFVIGQLGAINIDYEFVDFSNMNYGPSYDFTETNSEIESKYGSQHAVRVGTEWRYDIMKFRAGYSWSSSPYKNDINDGVFQTISAGFGFRYYTMAVDFAYQHGFSNSDYYPYSADPYGTNGIQNPVIAEKQNSNSYLLTFSFRF